MRKLIAFAVLCVLLFGLSIGCASEDKPNSYTTTKGSDADYAPMELSSSFAFYISDTYLSDIGVTAGEFFGDYAESTVREVFDDTGYTGLELLAGYADLEGMPGIFDLSSTRISDIMDFQVVETEAGEVSFVGEFSAILPPGAVRIYLDVEFPTAISDYGGDAIQGSMLSEGVKASLDIIGPGEFYITGN